MKKRIKFFAGCLFLIFLLPFLLVLPTGAAGSESSAEPLGWGIKIMSYNVMDDCSPNSNGVFPYDSPANREDAIVEMLKVYEPDVIGMQEAGDGGTSGILDWCSALDEDLNSIYGYRSLTDETGYKMDICRGLIIFYKESRFTLLDSGAQGYSQPANNKRCYQWVKLRDNQTDVDFYVFNTHWHVDGKISLEENEVIRTVQMQELADKVNSIAKDYHAFLTGDFNSFYSPKNSMGDTVNITRLQEKTGFVDALLTTKEMYSINAAGTKTVLQPNDSGLMTSADHVVYPPDFYTPVKLERILSRTYTPKLSDHDAFLVYFNYKMPTLTVRAGGGELDAYFSNGAYYIDNLKKGTADLPIQVELSMGEIYIDEACTQSAGTDLTIKNGSYQTYREKNTYYIKFGNAVFPLYLRACNSNAITKGVLVDPSLADKAPGSKGLYCDKWYCRPVTVGVDGFATIQEAVDAARDGYRVMVAPGTYTEDVTYSGKSLEFYGSNRNNAKALVMKNGHLTVNTGRTYETYLSGSITFSFGDLQTGSLMVNGFHFIDHTATGQIRVTGGNAKKTVDLRISNNLFNCYTDGAVNNGSAIHLNSALQKTGSIVDNYFHLTEIPTYTDGSGNAVNYTNRGITMRNMKDMAIHANYFDGYMGNKIRPFWLSSEVSDSSTVAGYGNLDLTGNRFENSQSGSLYINNIRDDTSANVLIAGNSYGGEKLTVDFRETAKQGAQNLPTDKSKISFSVKTEDLPYLTIIPTSDSGISGEEFTHYVTFFNDGGTAVYDTSPILGTSADYKGPVPTKNATASVHYSFKEWVDGDGNALDLGSLAATTEAYASFTDTAHTIVMKSQYDPTCTEDGYTGDQECTVCGYLVEGSVIPAMGHSVVTEKGTAPTCTEPGRTEGSYCHRCKTVLAVQETIAPLGHNYETMITKAPTLKEEGVKTFICGNDSAHTYTEPVAALSKSLYFTFDNGAEAQARYNNYVYNFTTFDQIEAWRGRTQGYKEGNAMLDAAAGTLTVKPGTTVFTSIFADSVNFDLNFDPQDADSYQIRFKTKGFTGKSCKVGMYFYYGTDNSYVAAAAVAFEEEALNAGEYFIATGQLADRVRKLEEVNRVVIHLSGFDTPKDLQGEFTLDYVYVGPYEELPTPTYTVTFVDGGGNTLSTQMVYKGETAAYTGAIPTKAYDADYHYSFSGWDKELAGITADTIVTAQFTTIAHSYLYTTVNALSHLITCEKCDLSAEAAHSYKDGFCICGEPEIKDPMEDTKLKLGHTLNLAGDISVSFAVSKTTLEGFDLSTVYVESTMETYEGDGNIVTTTFKLYPEERGSYYYFTLTGLTAVNMNDSIWSVLHGIKNGQEYCSATDEYSIATYAYTQMNKANMPVSLKTLCADLLRYGAKAQIFKGYRTDNLADAAMTEAHRAFLSDMDSVTFGKNNTVLDDLDNAPIVWMGKTLDLASKVTLKFIFNPAGYVGDPEKLTLRVSFQSIDGETKAMTLTGGELYNSDLGLYAFTFDGLLAAELRAVVSVQIYGDDTPVSCTLLYSADTYGNNRTGDLLTLCKALFAYSDSAKAYFGT